MEIKEVIRDKKKPLILTFVIVLLLCILFVLVVNQYPSISTDWSAESKSLVKQYSKVIGFLSIMGLVYVVLEGKKNELPNEIEDENDSD
ncbi:hypothetical protein [Labilibaculum sp.]|uniref:hypothetical protein n=1 Tax=Labilibaculum sp. TaxID=2060723 RepID=UPI00356A9D56